VSRAKLQRLFGEKAGVNSAIDDPGSALARQPADLHAAEGVGRMDANPNDVARLNAG